MAFTNHPSLNKNTSSSSSDDSVLYPLILCDEEYFTLYRFLERANNFIVSRQGRLSKTYHDNIDSLVCGVDSNNIMEVTLYDALAIMYKKIKYVGCTIIHPGMIQVVENSAMIDLNPTTILPKKIELKKEMEDVYIQLNGQFYTNDIGAELFQYSTMYKVLSENEVREIVNRLYNLPKLPGYQLSLYNNLGLFDAGNISDLNYFYKGY